MTIDEYRFALDAKTRAAVDTLRALVQRSHPGLAEQIKWNAPSFSHAGQDRVTLGLDRKGGLRMVLHRGAKAADPSGFSFQDPAGLARWPAPDRGVVTFGDPTEIGERSVELQDLVSRWIQATA